jgi:hypothetical protein
MRPLFHRHRFEWLVLAGGAAVLLLYLVAFRPLARRAEALNQPLNQAWNQLVTNRFSIAADPTDFVALQRAWHESQSSVTAMRQLRTSVEARLELDEGLRQRLGQPFKLIDFQNDRQMRLEELVQLAEQQKVGLDSALAAGFPRFTPDLRKPDLLWAQLGFLEQLVRLAMDAKVSRIQSVQVFPIQTRTWSPAASETLEEISVGIELVGSMPAVVRMLASLPLSREEAEELGLPQGSADRPSMFIGPFLIRKVAPERPDEVQLILQTHGFVYRQESLPL